MPTAIWRLFVDAADCGEPGTVRVQRLSPEAGDVTSLTHHVQPAALLALARELYGRAPEALLVTGAGATFDGRESLSEPGRKALQEICRLVPQLIVDFRAHGDAMSDEGVKMAHAEFVFRSTAASFAFNGFCSSSSQAHYDQNAIGELGTCQAAPFSVRFGHWFVNVW